MSPSHGHPDALARRPEYPATPRMRLQLIALACLAAPSTAFSPVAKHLAVSGFGVGRGHRAAPLRPICSALREKEFTERAAEHTVPLPSAHHIATLEDAPIAPPTAAVADAADDDGGGAKLTGALLMLAVAVLWGTNFPAVKASIEAGLPVSAAAALRFSVAALALSPLLRDVRSLERDLVVGGLECGCWIALGYIAQALALQDLQAGAVAFVASLQVVFVPLVLTALGGRFTPRLALAAFLCVGGVALLELGGLSGQVHARARASFLPSLAYHPF